MYWNISDQLNEGQFLFYSIIVLYKNHIFIYTASILDTCHIIVFSFKQNKKKNNKTSKHIKSKELELSQHLIHPGIEGFDEKHIFWENKTTFRSGAWQVN